MPKKTALQVTDLFKVKTIKHIKWSPTGDYAVVVVQTSNVAEQRNETGLWLYRHADGSFRQISYGPADSTADWLDDETIFFVARKRTPGEDEADKPFSKTRFYTMSARGGEPHPRGVLDGVVWSWELSPNRKKLVLSFSPNPDITKDQAALWKKIARPKIPDGLRYKIDALGYLPDAYPAIFAVDIKADGFGQPKALTSEPSVWDNDPIWHSNDRIIFNRHQFERGDAQHNLFSVDLKGQLEQLPTFTGAIYAHGISPDGKQMAFTGQTDSARCDYMPALVYECPVSSSGKTANQARAVAETVGRFGVQITIGDIVDTFYSGKTIRWIDKETIVTTHSIQGRTELARVNLKSGEVTSLTGQTGVVHAFDAHGDKILYAMASHTTVNELYFLEASKSPAKKGGATVSTLNAAVKDTFDITPQRWQVKTEPGAEVDVRLWLTPAQQKAEKGSLPLIFSIHGGPQIQIGEGPYFENQFLTHNGFPVVMSNPRGSTGYGDKHGPTIFGNWGDRDIHDLLTVLQDTLKRYPQFDPKRVFCIGGSYGGYMTNMMMTRKPGVFRAFISDRSICNFLSFSGAADLSNYFPPVTLGLKSIFDNPQRAWDLSPISQIRNVSEPVLIIHQDQDLRCPFSQAEELFTALVDMGKRIGEEVRFVIFRDEPHGMSRIGKPGNKQARLEEMLAWLKKHDVQPGAVKKGKKK